MAWAAALLSLLALTLRAVSADELNPDYRPGDTWVDGLLRYRITDADAIASTAVGLPAELMAASQPVFCTEKNMYTLSLTISLCLPSTEYTKLATLSLTSISNARQVAVQYTYLACSSAVGAPTTVTPITGPPSMEVMLGRTTPTVAGAVAVRVCPNLDCAVLPTDLVFATLPTASLIVPTSLTNLVDCAPTLANGVSYQEGQSGACKCVCPASSGSDNSPNVCSCSTGKGLLDGACQTCPAGSSVVNGACKCSGATSGFINSVCTVCPTGSSVIEGVCTCSAGRSMTGGQCTCPSTSTFVNNACVCLGGQTLVNNACTCPSTSVLTGSGSSALCLCPGSTSGFVNGACAVCPSGSSAVSGVCTCSGGRSLVGGQCTCPSTSTFDGSACVCAGGQTLVNNVCTCPSTSVLTGSGSSALCLCPGSTSGFVNGACAVCPSGSSAVSGVCTCSGGRSLVGGQCTCPSTSTFDGSACVCAGGQTLVNNVCTCPSTSVLTGSGSSALCKCPGDFEFDTFWNCGCPDGQEQDGNFNLCKCPNHKIKDGLDCKCPVGATAEGANGCTCSGGRDIVDGECKCPSGQEFTNDECVPICFWQANNLGYDCAWTDPSKTLLTLKDDCQISAPAALDNYVADERDNKNDDTLGDPVISITATQQGASVGATKKATWKEYVLTPTTLENKVTFNTFGVFDLEMTATDYSAIARCSGCVAIVDKYPPTAETKCQTTVSNTLSTPASYADGKLAEAIAQEGKFTAFYTNGNIKNNDGASDVSTGANERCDDLKAEMQDFFAPSASKLASLDGQCFDNDFVKKLLNTAPRTSLLASATQGELDGLQCTRCCSKSLGLKEYYYDYKCGTDISKTEKKTATSDSCAFDYCLEMPSNTLVEASAAVTDSVAEETTAVLSGLPTSVPPALNVIHHSIKCTAVNAGCSYTPTLGDLLTHTASWGVDDLALYDVEDYVFWRYAVDTENWVAWSDSAALTFTNTRTTVYVEAWTPCGRAYRDSFVVVLHPHSPHNACGTFRQMWTENSPTPRTNAETHMCAYPGSDFVMMTFAYDSDADATHDPDTVKGRYTDVKCYVRLAEGGPGNVDKVKEAALPLTWPTSTSGRIEISKQLALELVYDPETSETTDVKVSCDFTYEYFNSEQTDTESCNYPFTLKDCDAPELHTSDTAECALGSPIDVPGPFEACNGNVFTTVSGASQPETALKAVNDACCASSPVLNCVSLTESAATGGVKRCEATTRLMMATELRVNDEDDGDTKLTASASPSAAELLVASAMAAIVALIAVKHRMAGAARQASEVDDFYVNLLD